MAVHRRVTKVGNSLAVIIPRDLAESMGIDAGAPVRLTLVGRQMVVEPEDDTMDDDTFRRSFATVLRRYSRTFAGLAAHDRKR